MKAKLFASHLLRFHPRLIVAIAVGAGVAAVWSGSAASSGVLRVLVGWDAAAWTYLAMMWLMFMTTRLDRVRDIAEHEDETAVVVLSVVSLSAIASVVAIVQVLATAKGNQPHLTLEHVLFAAITLVAGWLLMPTIYTLHYARLYFTDKDAPRALIFPDKNVEPDYWDFLYFSLTIAVASQTSDVALASKRMRRAALAQSVLAFFFNLAVLGLSINIGAGLLS
jgi:uncharacterized membrane protein